MNKRRLSGKTVLVTGGAGFMGSNFIHQLLAAVPDVRVINLDLLTYAGNPENLKGVPQARYSFVEGDICDTALVTKLFAKSDYVVNFAAESHVDRSIHGGARTFMRTNVEGVLSVLEALRASEGIELMIHISTDEVWGDLPLKSSKRFNEQSPFKPSSPYAASKAGGDLLAHAYHRTYGVPVIVTHATNNFGPRQYPEKMIPFFITQAQRGKPVTLYGDGKNRRDWLFVEDHSRAIQALLERGVAGEAYGISQQGAEPTNRWMAELILRELGKSASLITYIKDRPGHDLRYAVDSSKIRKLGWKPRVTLEAGIKRTIEWYEEHGAWLENVLARTAKVNPHIGV